MFELIPAYRNHYATFNPFKELEEMRKTFFNDDSFFNTTSVDLFKTDIKDDGENFVLEADLPGFDKKDINIDIDGDYMTIKAERHSDIEKKEKKDSYIRCERSYGSYSRRFDISAVDAEKINAKYDNGVLTVEMPRKTPIAPASRKLEIQ